MGNPVRVLHREAIVDTTLLGHRIPKGTVVMFSSEGPGFKKPAIPVDASLRSEHSRTKYQGGSWEPRDLALFNPERWLKKDESGDTVFDAQAGPFLSFSLGPRGCFGKKLAYMEMRMVISLLVWHFKFRKLDGGLVNDGVVEGVTTVPKNNFVSLEEVQ